jgi:hypothetical protein
VTLEGTEWLIEDELLGARGKELRGYLHFHPDVRVERTGDTFRAVSGNMVATIAPFGVSDVLVRVGEHHPQQGWYCPEFGVSHAATVLELRVDRDAGGVFGYRITTA